MGRQRPASVTNAIRAQLALVGVGGLTTVLTVLQREELVRSWSSRHPAGIDPPSFVPVAVVLFITFALLAAVLVVFFRGGHGSARLALTVLAGFFLLAMFAVFRLEPPVEFVVLAVVSALLDLVVVFFLWHRDTGEFVRGAALAAHTR
jgi:O-antigen/teichoic acid export membrane protein